MGNAYLTIFRSIHADSDMRAYRRRYELTMRYAWAVPDDGALAEVARHAPLIEIGAGGGYWAFLLRELGADVLVFDTQPHGSKRKNPYTESRWTEVEYGGVERIAEHPDRTLFICWPEYNTPMAADCLFAYHGHTLVYIGETAGGCNADDAFFAALRDGWSEELVVEIPQWDGIHDQLIIYKRLVT